MSDFESFQSLLTSGQVFYVSKPGCPFCVSLASELTSHSVPFTEYIPKDQDETDTIKLHTNMTSFPMLFIGKKLIGGYNDLIHLVMTNQLATLLETVGIEINTDF
jgi:glutaredoxin